jgi:hypothetical protein
VRCQYLHNKPRRILHTEHIMAEHARRERSHALPLQLLIHELAFTSERPAVDIQDEHLLAQLLREFGLAVQVVYIAVLVGEVRRVDWVQDGAVKGFYYGGHRSVLLHNGGIVSGRKAVHRGQRKWVEQCNQHLRYLCL